MSLDQLWQMANRLSWLSSDGLATVTQVNQWLVRNDSQAVSFDDVPVDSTHARSGSSSSPERLVGADEVYAAVSSNAGGSYVPSSLLWGLLTDAGFNAALQSQATRHAQAVRGSCERCTCCPRVRRVMQYIHHGCWRTGVACRCVRSRASYGVARADGLVRMKDARKAASLEKHRGHDGRYTSPAFFYPQRLLTAFGLSMVLCGFFFMVLISGVEKAQNSIDAAFEQVDTAQVASGPQGFPVHPVLMCACMCNRDFLLAGRGAGED